MIGPMRPAGPGYHRAMPALARPATRGLAWFAAGLAATASLAVALGASEHIDDAWVVRGVFLAVALAEMALAVVLVAWTWPAELPVQIGPVLLGGAILAGASVVGDLMTLAGVGTHVAHDPGSVAAGPRAVDVLTKGAELGLAAVLLRLRALLDA